MTTTADLRAALGRVLVAAALALAGPAAAADRPEPAGPWSRRYGAEVVRVPAGTFLMGSSPDEPGRDDDEGPVRVTLSQPLLVMRSEVTQRMWVAVVELNPSVDVCDDCPVEDVSWIAARRFANRLSRLDGLTPAYVGRGRRLTLDAEADGWRLPTEAEWEYAARAGERNLYAGSDEVQAVGWTTLDATASRPVCTKAPNAWGLCDLTGNVWEWTEDGYAQRLPGGVDPLVPERGEGRVVRGGSWHSPPADARVAFRAKAEPTLSTSHLGFRLVRAAP